ncbi:MAG: hypothetical protein ACOH18_03445 [Candidatus Saccharimonadaceae bacterium]
MDKDHRLTAPDNESLRAIEQVGDHSELAGIYPDAHNEWESVGLLSREAREEKRNQEQLLISQSIRKWFAVIGLLVPVPFISAFIIIAISATYLHADNIALLLIPALIGVSLWLFISFISIKKVYAIFYSHSIRVAPFLITLLLLVLLSLQALYVTILGLYTDSIIYNTIISSLVVLVTSIGLSGILILIWTSIRLSAAYKIGCIGIVAGAILIVTLLVNVF